jgi:hypothetical protein
VTRDFLLDAAERALKTFVQSLLAVLTVQGVSSLLDVDWLQALSVAGLATVISVLTSLLSVKLGGNGTASATDAVVTTAYADAVAHGRHAAGLRNGPA